MQKRCIIYGRVSTISSEQDLSIEEQTSIDENSIYHNYLKENDYEVLRIFSDRESGTTDSERPGFVEMLDFLGIKQEKITISEREDEWHYDGRNSNFKKVFIPNPKKIKKIKDKYNIDLVMCSNSSRFTRTGSFDVIETLRNFGIYVYFVQEKINSKDYEKDVLLKILQILDRNKSEDISRKASAGIAQSMRRNQTLRVSNVIYGFQHIKKDVNTGEPARLVPIPEEAEVVKLIYDLYTNEVWGATRITNELNNRGLHPRQKVDKTTGELLPPKPWAKRSVQSILDNCRYAGLNPVTPKWDSGKVFVEKHSPRRIEYEYAPSEYIEPIISVEQFELAQYLKQKKIDEKSGEKKGSYSGLTLYSGRLRCYCGANYISNMNYKRKKSERKGPDDDGDPFYFYVCSRRKQKGLKVCSSPRFGREYIRDKVNFVLDNFSFFEKMNIGENINHLLMYQVFLMKKNKDTEIEKNISETKNKIDAIEKEYNNYVLSMTQLPDDLKEPTIDLLRTKKNELDALKKQLECVNQFVDESKALIAEINDEIKILNKGYVIEFKGMMADVLRYDIKLQLMTDEKTFSVKIGRFDDFKNRREFFLEQIIETLALYKCVPIEEVFYDADVQKLFASEILSTYLQEDVINQFDHDEFNCILSEFYKDSKYAGLHKYFTLQGEKSEKDKILEMFNNEGLSVIY